MKRYAYIGACILLLAALTACHADGGGKPSDSTVSPDSVTVSDSTQTPDSEQVPDSPEMSDSPQVPDSPEVPDSAEIQDSPQVPDSAEAPNSDEVPDSTAIPEPQEAVQPAARDLTDAELQKWSRFLCRAECNGFLMSSYKTPLEADLVFVFYSGAGVGERPTEEMVQDYLDANDLEEAYTDIIFIPYDEASKVLERRTGYTLEHFKLAGNDIPMYYSQKYAGYFQMAGDTNYMPVECVSGRLNADGSVFLEVRESSDWNEDSACSFETTLKPDSTGKNMLFSENVITGGWLTWQESEIED